MAISVQSAHPDQWREVAHLIYDSTNAWYEKNRGCSIFTGEKDSTLLFCRTYAALDGVENLLVAWDSVKERIAGSCFVHPRPTHTALGIMNVHPDYFGQGIAPLILRRIIEMAAERKQSLRLVSSAMNLDSFSLYNRLGFTPYAIYQDMLFPHFRPELLERELPEEVLALLPRVRLATVDDLEAMEALESEITGLNHLQDYAYFIQNPDGAWKTWVVEDSDGALSGFLSSVCDPGSCMLGPGLMRTESAMLGLIWTAYCFFTLERSVRATPVFLVPAHCSEALQCLYSLGARNTEIHLAQVRGSFRSIHGLVMPTFMPES